MAISIPLRAEAARRVGGIKLWLLVGAAVLALGSAVFFVSRSSVFHARGIEVLGAAHLSRAEVIDAAGVSRRTNVLWLDESAIERRLEAGPWVGDADVRLALPWTIEITVQERVPVAVVSDGIRETLVGADGTMLGPAGRTRGLPVIALPSTVAVGGVQGSPADAAAALGAMPPDLRAEVVSVTVLADGALEIGLRGGVRVRFGSAADHRRKVEALARILTWARSEGERLEVVNVVSPDAPAVRFGG